MQCPNGIINTMSTTVYQDAGVQIDFRVVTPKIDGGNNNHKFWYSLELIGDLVTGTAQVRHTNNDYTTWSNYRTLTLNAINASGAKPIIYQLGDGRRKAFDILCTLNQPLRWECLEVDMSGGTE